MADEHPEFDRDESSSIPVRRLYLLLAVASAQLRRVQATAQAARQTWNRATSAERAELVSRYAPRWVSLLLAMVVLSELIELASVIRPSPVTRWQAPQLPSKASVPADYAGIIQAHLFGVAEAKTPEAEMVAAPVTSLNLEIRGLVASTDVRLSHAIIADSNGGENLYFVDSSLPGGATLVAITTDRVILKRDGQFEALLLPRTGPLETIGEDFSDSQQAVAYAPDAPVAPIITVQPPRLADIMMPRPRMTSGVFKGMEIFPGEHGDQFTALGLKPGDLITAVDGRPLAAGSASLPFQKLVKDTSLTLTVERQGKVRTVRILKGQLATGSPGPNKT